MFHALAGAADAAGATVVDGGTDAGVMAFMGRARADHARRWYYRLRLVTIVGAVDTHADAYPKFAARVEEVIQRDVQVYISEIVGETEEKREAAEQK